MGKVVGKIFSESEVRAIAQALGHTEDGLSNTEIDEILQLCQIPDEHGPGTKWKRLYFDLWNKQARDGHRKSCLAFIRKASKPERYLSTPERFEALRGRLNMALAFAGLEIDEQGNLLSVEAVHTLADAERRAKELRSDLVTRGVHADVLAFCRPELLADNYFHAVLEAVKSIMEKLRDKAGLQGVDGAPLTDRVLSGDSPILAINALTSVGERSEQAGFANLIKGTYGMFRTPTAHDPRIR